jgi:hypothetical protein
MENMNHQEDFDIMRPSWRNIVAMIMFWLGLAVALLWAILKTIGYINSPPWQEALPIFGFVIALVGGAYQLGLLLGDLVRAARSTRRAIARLDMRMDRLESEMIESRVEFKTHMGRYHQ